MEVATMTPVAAPAPPAKVDGRKSPSEGDAAGGGRGASKDAPAKKTTQRNTMEPSSSSSSRTIAHLEEAQRHLHNGKQLLRDCAVRTNNSNKEQSPQNNNNNNDADDDVLADFMDDTTRFDLLAVALQDLFKALQVQEYCLGRASQEAQETRLLILQCHANRKNWGRAGLWMLNMLRVVYEDHHARRQNQDAINEDEQEPAGLLAYVQGFGDTHPAIKALTLAREALREERTADAAADHQEDYDRAGSLYDQAIQRIDQIYAMDGGNNTKNSKKNNGEDDVFYINGVAMTVNGVLVLSKNSKKKNKGSSPSAMAASILPIDYAEIYSKLGQAHRMQERWVDAKFAIRKAYDWYLFVLGSSHPTTSTAQQQYKSVSAMVADLGLMTGKGEGGDKSIGSGRSLRSAFSFLKKKKTKKTKKKTNTDRSGSVGDVDSLGSLKSKKKNTIKFFKKIFGNKNKKTNVAVVDDSLHDIQMPDDNNNKALVVDMSDMEIGTMG